MATKAASDILRSAEEAEVQAVADLHTNLRRMVNEPDFSDVLFVCNDGKKVQAIRMLLAGRSAVFKSMLTSGMAESNLSEIELPEISSPVLLSVFEFLYTGSLSDYYPHNWTTACEIKVASLFFLLPGLESIITKFLLNHIIGTGGDLPAAASLLTEAVRFKALSDEPDVSLRELVTILNSNWSDSTYIAKLSQDAMHFLLTSTNDQREDFNELSFEEYLRFKQVIRWWVCQSDYRSEEAEDLVNFITLDEERALTIYAEHIDRLESQVEDSARLSSEWSSLQLDEASRISVARLLSNIDCRRIHPVLLAKVVEPLNIISSAEIQNAFRVHALRAPRSIRCRREFIWKFNHGAESHLPFERGCAVQKFGFNNGLAVMMAAMSSSSGLYQWHFILEEIPESRAYCELGFIYASEVAMETVSLEGKRLCDLYHARVLYFSKIGAKINWAGAGGHTAWQCLEWQVQTGSKAEFKLNTYKRSCSLILDGQDMGIVWENLPKARYYLAVSLGNSRSGLLSIELVSGFNML